MYFQPVECTPAIFEMDYLAPNNVHHLTSFDYTYQGDVYAQYMAIYQTDLEESSDVRAPVSGYVP